MSEPNERCLACGHDDPHQEEWMSLVPLCETCYEQGRQCIDSERDLAERDARIEELKTSFDYGCPQCLVGAGIVDDLTAKLNRALDALTYANRWCLGDAGTCRVCDVLRENGRLGGEPGEAGPVAPSEEER